MSIAGNLKRKKQQGKRGLCIPHKKIDTFGYPRPMTLGEALVNIINKDRLSVMACFGQH